VSVSWWIFIPAFLTFTPLLSGEYCDKYVCLFVCVSVCVCVCPLEYFRKYILIFNKYFMYVAYGRVSILLWRRCDALITCVKKVKFSHTRYRALGPELIPVYRQSARR